MDHENSRKVIRAIRSFLTGILIGILTSIVVRYCIPIIPEFWSILAWGVLVILIYLVILLVESYYWLVRAYTRDMTLMMEMKKRIDTLKLLLGYFLIVWAIPTSLVYWIVSPQYPKKAVQLGVFFMSSGIAILYYLKNPKKFPSVADKVTFFSGVCIGPISVIEILM